MKKFFKLLTTILLVGALCVSVLPAAAENATVSLQFARLTVGKTIGGSIIDPYFSVSVPGGLDTAKAGYAALCYRIERESPDVDWQLFAGGDKAAEPSGDYPYEDTLGEWAVDIVSTEGIGNWAGTLEKVRLDPLQCMFDGDNLTPGTQVDIAWLAFFETEPEKASLPITFDGMGATALLSAAALASAAATGVDIMQAELLSEDYTPPTPKPTEVPATEVPTEEPTEEPTPNVTDVTEEPFAPTTESTASGETNAPATTDKPGDTSSEKTGGNKTILWVGIAAAVVIVIAIVVVEVVRKKKKK